MDRRVEMRAGVLAAADIVPVPGRPALVVAGDLLDPERQGLTELWRQRDLRKIRAEGLREIDDADAPARKITYRRASDASGRRCPPPALPGRVMGRRHVLLRFLAANRLLQNVMLPTDVPPQTYRVCPVTKSLSGEVERTVRTRDIRRAPRGALPESTARSPHVSALSSGMIESNTSVSSIGPGATAFTVMPGGELESPGAGQANHAGLGRRVNRTFGESQNGPGGHQHHPPVVRLLHVLEIGLHQRDRSRRDAG